MLQNQQCPVGGETDDRIPNKLQRFKHKLARLEDGGRAAYFYISDDTL